MRRKASIYTAPTGSARKCPSRTPVAPAYPTDKHKQSTPTATISGPPHMAPGSPKMFWPIKQHMCSQDNALPCSLSYVTVSLILGEICLPPQFTLDTRWHRMWLIWARSHAMLLNTQPSQFRIVSVHVLLGTVSVRPTLHCWLPELYWCYYCMPRFIARHIISGTLRGAQRA